MSMLSKLKNMVTTKKEVKVEVKKETKKVVKREVNPMKAKSQEEALRLKRESN